MSTCKTLVTPSIPLIGGIACDLITGVLTPLVSHFIANRPNEAASKRREKKKEMKKSEQYFDVNHISNNLYDEILRLSGDHWVPRTSYITLALRTNKLIAYAMYYMVCDSAKLICADKDDKEFINGVGYMAGFGKIFKNSETADISIYDAASAKVGYNKNYLLDYAELFEMFEDLDFQDKWKGKLARQMILNTSIPKLNGSTSGENSIESSRGFNARVDEEGYIHPIFFDPNTIVKDTFIKQGAGISDEVFIKFESVFAPLMANSPDKHRYIIDNNGNYNIVISRENAMGAEDYYLIDDGTIMGGNGVYILGNFINNMGIKDSVFVNCITHKDLTANILSSIFFIIDTDNVMSIINNDYFRNSEVYRFIDFSNTKWLDNITDPKERLLLEKNLTAAIKVSGGMRFRFLDYSSPSKFTLISDKHTKSPLAFMNATSSNINEGAMVSVSDTTLVIKNDGFVNNFTIEYKQDE